MSIIDYDPMTPLQIKVCVVWGIVLITILVWKVCDVVVELRDIKRRLGSRK